MTDKESFNPEPASLNWVIHESIKRAYTPKELIENLQRLARILGRNPTSTDLLNKNINTGPSAKPYQEAGFNYWLDRAGLKRNVSGKKVGSHYDHPAA
jgi:hypothetical protein